VTKVENNQGKWGVEAEIKRHGRQSRAIVAEPEATESEGIFRTCVAVARQQQAKSLELSAAGGMARLWYDQGQNARRGAPIFLAHVWWFTEGFGHDGLEGGQIDAGSKLKEWSDIRKGNRLGQYADACGPMNRMDFDRPEVDDQMLKGHRYLDRAAIGCLSANAIRQKLTAAPAAEANLDSTMYTHETTAASAERRS